MNAYLNSSNQRPKLIHHAASCDGGEIPGSLQALQNCINNRASMVEIDIIPLVDGDYALLHDPQLESATNGRGNVIEMTTQQIQNLLYLRNGIITDQPVGTLSQVVAAMQSAPYPRVLQLDLKPYGTLMHNALRNLLDVIAPVKDRILISSVADWAIRRLHSLDAEVALGFDPSIYIEVNPGEPRPEGVPPFLLGAYGYLDDHPLGAQRWGPADAYLRARAEALLTQVSIPSIWFIHAALLVKSLEDGFDWIAYLHQQGSKVTAWTLDAGSRENENWVSMLANKGVDFITTNTAAELAKIINSPG